MKRKAQTNRTIERLKPMNKQRRVLEREANAIAICLLIHFACLYCVHFSNIFFPAQKKPKVDCVYMCGAVVAVAVSLLRFSLSDSYAIECAMHSHTFTDTHKHSTVTIRSTHLLRIRQCSGTFRRFFSLDTEFRARASIS